MRIALAILLSVFPLFSFAFESSEGAIRVEKMAEGLDEPWAIGFLPNGDYLITERDGRLWVYGADGNRRRVTGTPEVVAAGQGGLLDVLVPSDFSKTREIYLTYAVRQGRRSGTAVGKGTLSNAGNHLSQFKKIFEIAPGSSGRTHFGSRLVEGADGFLYMTVGDRGDRPSAQDLGRHNGSVLRLGRDGAPAPGNPFTSVDGAQPEIWSLGHRNPQGATRDLDGTIMVVEHGARGGDEVNLIKSGANYGWPVIAYGRHYTGGKIGEGTHKEGMEQPAFYWDPSMAPSGMMVYSGRLWPEWRGDIFIGSLKFDYISRLEGRRNMIEAEQLRGPETNRVRDVREAPDGSIWFLSVGNGAAYRLSPS